MRDCCVDQTPTISLTCSSGVGFFFPNKKSITCNWPRAALVSSQSCTPWHVFWTPSVEQGQTMSAYCAFEPNADTMKCGTGSSYDAPGEFKVDTARCRSLLRLGGPKNPTSGFRLPLSNSSMTHPSKITNIVWNIMRRGRRVSRWFITPLSFFCTSSSLA